MGNRSAAQPFTKKDVEVLVKLSGKSEKEINDWYKEFHIESEETDRMNKRQFQIFYTKLKKNPKLDQITDHIFRAFDTDHSGREDIFFSSSSSFFHSLSKALWIFGNFSLAISSRLQEATEKNSNMLSKHSISMKMIESKRKKRRRF